MIYETLHRKLKIEQYEPPLNAETNYMYGCPEG